MTCLEVRDRLTEHSLGLLSRVDAGDVERHLRWCAGCRKESSELQEGASMMALSLPSIEPPPSLESRVVERITAVAGTSRIPSRRRVRLLTAATLTAAMIALSAVGWAITERGQVQHIRQETIAQIKQVKDLERILQSLEANPLEAKLFPILDATGSGRVLIYSSPDAPDFILASVSLVEPARGKPAIALTDRAGRVISGGVLARNNNGVLIFYEESGKNLSRGTSVTVMDGSGRPVLGGLVQPSAEG